MSRFCSLFSFFIALPFARGRSAGRDDPYGLFSIPLKARVNHKQHRVRMDRSKGHPAIFVACRFIELRQSPGIVEDQYGGFEAHIMLAKISPVLVRVPFKVHGRCPASAQTNAKCSQCQYNCMYSAFGDNPLQFHFGAIARNGLALCGRLALLKEFAHIRRRRGSPRQIRHP